MVVLALKVFKVQLALLAQAVHLVKMVLQA
jgi:hypothetical protein